MHTNMSPLWKAETLTMVFSFRTPTSLTTRLKVPGISKKKKFFKEWKYMEIL